MKVIAYYRVSTDMQIDSGAGLASQEDICKAWCSKNNLEICRSFVEKAISGAAPLDKRPALFNAISVLGKGDILLVSRLDRISRDLYGGILIDEAIAHQKAKIVSAAGEGTENDDPASKMIREIIRVVAGFERNITQFRIKAALAAKKARGEQAGSLRFGLMVGPDKKLMPDPKEKPHLDKMVEFRKMGLSLKQTAQEMNAIGLLNRLDRKWTHDSIARALKQTPIGSGYVINRSWS